MVKIKYKHFARLSIQVKVNDRHLFYAKGENKYFVIIYDVGTSG
jgi:hypothetical protein